MLHDLLSVCAETGRRLDRGGCSHTAEIGANLSWAAYHLEASRVGASMLQCLSSPRRKALQQLLGCSDWEPLETGGMSLGFGSAVTALDLCADALYLASGGTPAADGAFKNVGYWRKDSRRTELREQSRSWIENLIRDQQWHELFNCWRAAITHRRLTRHIAIKLGAGDDERAISRVAPPGLTAQTGPDAHTKVSELLDFAQAQFTRFCTAVSVDYG